MPWQVSQDLKDRIPVLRYKLGHSVDKIGKLLGIKKTLIYQTLAYHHDYSVTYNTHARHTGRPHILNSTDICFIKALLSQQHCLYLDEIHDELLMQRGTEVSIATLVWALCHLLISHKHVSVQALERNDILRSAFMNMIATEVPDPEMLIFIDEAAKNERTPGRSKGWAVIGERCVQRRCFIQGQ